MLVIGLIKAYGILFVQFLRRFQASTSETSVILGIKAAAFSLSAMLALNILITRISIRKLSLLGSLLTSAGILLSMFAKNVAFIIFTQSLLTGLGNAFVYGPGIYLLGQYFDKKRPLAIAIANSGISIGLMALPTLITYLFDEYGFQGALMLLGGIMMQTIVCAALFRPYQHQEAGLLSSAQPSDDIGDSEAPTPYTNVTIDNELDGSQTEQTSFTETSAEAKMQPRSSSFCGVVRGCMFTMDLSLFKNPIFIGILGFSFFGLIGNELSGAFIPPLAKEKGLTDMETAKLFTVAAALDLFSRLLPGLIAQFGLMTRPKMLAGAFLIIGVTFQFTSFCSNFRGMLGFIIVYGSFAGFFFSLLPVIIIDLMGLDKFPKAFGFVQVSQGIAGALVYPVLGTFRDLTGNYSVTFHFLGASLLLAAGIILTEPLLRRWEARCKGFAHDEAT
ncbi:monocarboxylate transporter 3-like [Haliotis rubra]|uniref:monocarboxylate transporter 3-like n=1 Tax=Haliotis rubra TaxID=36100 RepID=UPI001EE4F4DE|nr:monocarboxylate transporter 3-like [Haliotis rubra]